MPTSHFSRKRSAILDSDADLVLSGHQQMALGFKVQHCAPGKWMRNLNSSFHLGQRLFHTTLVFFVTLLRTLSLRRTEGL